MDATSKYTDEQIGVTLATTLLDGVRENWANYCKNNRMELVIQATGDGSTVEFEFFAASVALTFHCLRNVFGEDNAQRYENTIKDHYLKLADREKGPLPLIETFQRTLEKAIQRYPDAPPDELMAQLVLMRWSIKDIGPINLIWMQTAFLEFLPNLRQLKENIERHSN